MGLLLRKLNSKQKGLLLNNPFYEKKWVSSEIFMPSWAFGRKKIEMLQWTDDDDDDDSSANGKGNNERNNNDNETTALLVSLWKKA